MNPRKRCTTFALSEAERVCDSSSSVCLAQVESSRVAPLSAIKTRRTRVAFYSQHLIGVGHHFRNRQIVNELVKTCDVFFIDGGRPNSRGRSR